MKVKKIPMRTCVVTHEKLPKQELIKVIIDLNGKANGRGAYLKKDVEVFEKAKKNKVLNKQLEIEVPDEIFEQLKELVK